MKKCITHHHSCTCREEKIKRLLKMLVIDEHIDMLKFAKGFSYRSDMVCTCAACNQVRELYPEFKGKCK